MKKCPQCGFELTDNAKFCLECGARIPQEKECPNCHTKALPNAKFCMECGHRFGGNAPAAPNTGVSMGDKNVIAGDVIGKKLIVKKTFIHNEDETRKLVKCHICNRNMAISKSIECPHCGETVCGGCYDRDVLLCSNCKEKEYSAIIRKVMSGESIDLTRESGKAKTLLLNALEEELGIQIDGTTLKEYQFSEQTKRFAIPLGITEIAEEAFFETDIIAVEIPSTVKHIRKYAFLKCFNLQKVVLNEGLESIGEQAFGGCEKLSEIAIPGSVKKIEECAFIKCINLQEVVLNDGVESIGKNAFQECEKLSEIVIPGSVKKIEKSAFIQLPNLRKVVLSEGLETIGEFAFQECAKLSEVDVPGSVKRIEHCSFSLCPNLQKVVLNDGLETIGEGAFWQCSNLSEINIPNSVTKIEDDAFKECPSLSSLRVPSSTLLGNNVFAGKIIRI